MTRFEAIKDLSVEEFAVWMTVAVEQPICEAVNAKMDEKGIKEQTERNYYWLMAEVGEGELNAT